MNIAVDGKKFLIGLEVPGMDIVGFEHEPSTPKERAAIPDAKAKLANALALFKPEAKARCVLHQVKVSLEAGNEGEPGKETKDAAPAPASKPKEAGREDKPEQSPEHGQEQKAQPAGGQEHDHGKETKGTGPAAAPASKPEEAGREDKPEQSPEHGQEQKAQPAGGQEHEHNQGQGQKATAEIGHEDEAGHHHSEFHAEYALTCRAPQKLTSMTFEYFKVFPATQELEVNVVTPKGQSSHQVKRDKPTLDLTGIM